MSRAPRPGFVVLQGNRLESLRDRVFAWFAREPLAPLEEEIVLVQSNAAADWLKMSMATATGVCAAMRLELPGRFVWRMYRAVLGPDRVAPQSALDRDALVWRLMHELPRRLHQPLYAPVAAFLADGDVERRLQLATRLAALFDQYQVFRADWLDAWLASDNGVTDVDGRRRGLADDQRWQPALWRDLVRALDDAEAASIRPAVHRAFVDAIAAGAPSTTPLPRRVVLFGASHVSTQGLEALAALSTRVEVILAIPNPSRFYWGDILDGREALRAAASRHPSRGATDLAAVSLDAMHLHAHPLLAAWGRQGRDFIRQLDAFADAHARDASLAIDELDLFDDATPTSLLGEVQAAIRDLEPLAEHETHAIAKEDRSIAFAVCHGPQREVEVLHDRLLALFADEPSLAPRDVIVMVPDIDRFAPSIRAVFGQHAPDDARRIPYAIADLRNRGSNPLIVAVEWLLRAPEKRMRLSEVRDLFDVPAVATRFGVASDAVADVFARAAGAGVRWGLHAAHRERLGLEACGDQNSWAFGLRRMMLGYASGAADAFHAIEPDDEVGGLEAADVGGVAEFCARLDRWSSLARDDATPAEWSRRGLALLDDFVTATDERERVTIAALQSALAAWRAACDAARFDERVPLAILREAWLSGLEGLEASRRFLGGGVTFCTLMPLRAVPFEVVCLVGMDDRSFPRATRRDDFDLMGPPGLARPGDRSRRDDDRYLMLEALLSARRMLYVSWSGRSARDNSLQPPSVLVAQLRDYLDAGWTAPDGGSVVDALTVAHPLQPFSRRYFEGAHLSTFAREWREAHDALEADDADDAGAQTTDAPPAALRIADLVRFLRNPVAAYFRTRLDVVVDRDDDTVDGEERFELASLARYQMLEALLDDPGALGDDPGPALAARIARAQRAGRLPLGHAGTRSAAEVRSVLEPMIERWADVRARHPHAAPRIALRHRHGDVEVDDWLDGLRADSDAVDDGSVRVQLELSASALRRDDAIQAKRMLKPWITMLVASACDVAATVVVVGCDATIVFEPLARAEATRRLDDLLDAWRDGMTTPLPFAVETAAAFVRLRDAREVYEGKRSFAERDFCLGRVYPDFDALVADGRFAALAERLVLPMLEWGRSHTEISVHADAACVE